VVDASVEANRRPTSSRTTPRFGATLGSLAARHYLHGKSADCAVTDESDENTPMLNCNIAVPGTEYKLKVDGWPLVEQTRANRIRKRIEASKDRPNTGCPVCLGAALSEC
jgi:hypothetical protein